MAVVKKTKTIFLYPCECGKDFRIPQGKAGHVCNCPHCGRANEVGGLRGLRTLKSIELDAEYVSPIQFKIRAMLILMLLCALPLGLAQYIGFPIVLNAGGVLVVYAGIVLVLAILVHCSNGIAGWFWDIVQRK